MPANPPRDDRGFVIPHNHDEILNHHHVIRHTTPQDLCRNVDTGERRLSSGAFCESGDEVGGMSVDIEEWMAADGLAPLHYVTDPSHGAVRLNVAELRALGFQVGWDPLVGTNLHHGEVWGIGNGSGRRRKIANIAETLRKAQGED